MCQADGKDGAGVRLGCTQRPLSSRPPSLSPSTAVFQLCSLTCWSSSVLGCSETLPQQFDTPLTAFLNIFFHYSIAFSVPLVQHTIVMLPIFRIILAQYYVNAPTLYLLTHFACHSSVMWRISFFVVMVYWCGEPTSIVPSISLPLCGFRVWGQSALFLDAF